MGDCSTLRGWCVVAYPEPIPAVKGKDAEEFEKKLERFRLNGAQKEFYREAKRNFGNDSK